MNRRYARFSIGLLLVAICILLIMSPRKTAGQQSAVYPLVGSWNVSGTFDTPEPGPLIAVMNFNYGGTTVEFDTNGTNSSASPGESITLGTWKQTGLRTSKFVQRNYTYDGTGNLVGEAITSADLTLDPGGESFTAKVSVVFDSCTITQCPGPLQFGPFTGQITGRKF